MVDHVFHEHLTPEKVDQILDELEMSVWQKYEDKMNLVVFEPLKLERSWEIGTYRQIGGYEAWEKILREKPPREQIIEAVKASGLRGRGGAGFPDRREVELHAAQFAGAEISRLQFR